MELHEGQKIMTARWPEMTEAPGHTGRGISILQKNGGGDHLSRQRGRAHGNAQAELQGQTEQDGQQKQPYT